MPAFGWSVGDCISSIDLIVKTLAILVSTGRASSDYQALEGDLTNLRVVLDLLTTIDTDDIAPGQRPYLQKCVTACQSTLKILLEDIRKYQNSLGTNHTEPERTRVLKQLTWAIFSADGATKTRRHIAGHIESLSLVLQSSSLQALCTLGQRSLDTKNSVLSGNSAAESRSNQLQVEVANLQATVNTSFQNAESSRQVSNSKITALLDVQRDETRSAANDARAVVLDGLEGAENSRKTHYDAIMARFKERDRFNKAESSRILQEQRSLWLDVREELKENASNHHDDLMRHLEMLSRLTISEEREIMTAARNSEALRQKSRDEQLQNLILLEYGRILEIAAELKSTFLQAKFPPTNPVGTYSNDMVIEHRDPDDNDFVIISQVTLVRVHKPRTTLLPNLFLEGLQRYVFSLLLYLFGNPGWFRLNSSPLPLLRQDNIELHDALGRVRILALDLCRNRKTFEEILLSQFHNQPGEAHVREHRYRLLDEKADELYPQRYMWEESVKPGAKIFMSIIISALKYAASRCPNPECGKEVLASDSARKHTCDVCGLVFYPLIPEQDEISDHDINKYGDTDLSKPLQEQSESALETSVKGKGKARVKDDTQATSNWNPEIPSYSFKFTSQQKEVKELHFYRRIHIEVTHTFLAAKNITIDSNLPPTPYAGTDHSATMGHLQESDHASSELSEGTNSGEGKGLTAGKASAVTSLTASPISLGSLALGFSDSPSPNYTRSQGSSSGAALEASPPRTPPFLFQVDRMRANTNIRPMINRQGLWLPPRARFGSKIRDGQTTGKTYLFNGTAVEERPDLLSNAVHYKTVSMYFSRGYFYIVPYDATENQVGSGREVEGELFSDSDDAEHDPDEEPEPTMIDWSILHFHWELDGFVSKVFVSASETRLNTQRPDQRWVNQILTDAHHALPERRTSNPSCGGLSGDLAILIGLLAFSTADAVVDAVLRYSIRQLPWQCHERWRGEGWLDHRGFVIRVWSIPPYSTNEDLRCMENGDYGNIWA